MTGGFINFGGGGGGSGGSGHTHSNLPILEKFSEDSLGRLLYNGQLLLTGGTNWTPAQISTSLWLESEPNSISLGSGVSQWNDKSGNNRHLIQSTGSAQPAYISNVLNSKGIIRFDGVDDILNLSSSLDTVRTVVALMRWSSASGGARPLFGHPSAYDWHGDYGGNYLLDNSYASSYIKDGEKYVNGVLTSGLLARYTSWTLLSFVTTGNIRIQSLADDRGLTDSGIARKAYGDWAELVITSSAESISIRQKIEGYVCHNWGVTNILNSDHPYKVIAPKI